METQEQQESLPQGRFARLNHLIAPFRERWRVFDERHRRVINLLVALGLLSFLGLAIYLLKGMVQFI